LDQILLSYNHIQSIDNLERCPNLTVLDLHNNKIAALPDTICSLYHLKTLTVSNNDLSDINPKIAILDSLVRLAIEGNPLRSIKPAMRNAGAVQLKKFLKTRLGEEDLVQGE
jgi:Leucine-rich repeat (LRR) protein